MIEEANKAAAIIGTWGWIGILCFSWVIFIALWWWRDKNVKDQISSYKGAMVRIELREKQAQDDLKEAFKDQLDRTEAQSDMLAKVHASLEAFTILIRSIKP